VMVDPYDNVALANAIRTLDSDADLRADLSQRGKLQAAKYSPEVYRASLQKLYDDFL
jgi:glycosyltransferase involved in cell wall biosynthesis